MESSRPYGKRRYVKLNQLEFHFIDYGGDGPDLILLHGLASNARFWGPAAYYLAHSFRVLALDQRGHGSSAKPDLDYSFGSVAKDVEMFIRTLGIDKPLLVGHSWGGNVGVQVAVDYPDILSGLVCIDGGMIEPSSVPGASWDRTRISLTPPHFASMRLTWEELIKLVRDTDMGTLWGEGLDGFLKANFEIQSDLTVVPRLSIENHMSIVRALWDQKISSLYSKVKCPVLFIPTRMGGRDASTAGDNCKKEDQIAFALATIGGSCVIWMEDSVHDVPVQRPLDIATVIKNKWAEGFFDRINTSL